ncbi:MULTISPECIES: sensor histidine kinase [Peribacillus]|uniref:histidine kinase n=1 Tax=Peribacillus castrilensis TaxID=2897690 RepID=A0AAW9N8K2_9BACI|nr:HAMP domain-containing sensor histidine kinase [Peribacillus frigoritolerans]MEC0271545.1 HAMP domain-containing sensor histidine kinase [Peribacillus castrilensis]MEC0297179.1 HAMP domain-containing sensor histidine kinase [Peribacillus castrilensis]MEC0347061.1 HAMP domain-containing sensor histidine kinase [Peribacillus castrilensis]TFH61950.1 HAMP domain-containing histidine kinase [Peribacillus frigoritolerans]
MFQKTRLQLTLLNSIVFIVLIAILSRTIYFYTEDQIYKDVNDSLIKDYRDFNNGGMPGGRPQGEFLLGPGPSVIVWGPDDTIIEPRLSVDHFFKVNEQKFFPKAFDDIEEISVNGYTYRALSTQVDTGYGEMAVQFIRNVDTEKEMLDRLLLILFVGGGIGSLVAVGAGYLLAGRALIPVKKSWDQQQQFVSDASHEIRTPLAVIQSRADLLFQSPNATIEEKAVDISIISKEVRRLNKLVNGLLTLTRTDSNQMEVKKSNFFLDDLLMDIVEQYTDIASFQEKSIISHAPEQVVFHGDKERIHQLLVILVDNAMKFTGEGGEISLSCIKNASSIILTVEDNGIGIPQEELPLIFNRFYQVEQSRSANEGSGLGLSIAKWIVNTHQGNIKVTSEQNERTRFEITFPRNQRKN